MKISLIGVLFAAVFICVLASKEGVYEESVAISMPINSANQSPNLSIQDQLIQGFQSCPNGVSCPISSHRCCCGYSSGTGTVCMANSLNQWLCFDPDATQCCPYVAGTGYLLVCNSGYKCASAPGSLSGNECVKKGLSGGAIAGIIIAILVVIGIVIGVIYYRRKRDASYQAIRY